MRAAVPLFVAPVARSPGSPSRAQRILRGGRVTATREEPEKSPKNASTLVAQNFEKWSCFRELVLSVCRTNNVTHGLG